MHKKCEHVVDWFWKHEGYKIEVILESCFMALESNWGQKVTEKRPWEVTVWSCKDEAQIQWRWRCQTREQPLRKATGMKWSWFKKTTMYAVSHGRAWEMGGGGLPKHFRAQPVLSWVQDARHGAPGLVPLCWALDLLWSVHCLQCSSFPILK